MEESNRSLSNVMKASKLIVFVVLMFGLVLAPIAYAQILTLEKTWGGSGGDYDEAVAVDSSGIYLAGYTYSFGAGGSDVLLLKYDSSGSLIWQRTWGGSGEDRGLDVAVYSSVIYVTGYTKSFGDGSKNIVLKFDSSGSLVWQRTYGTSQFDEGRGVAVDSSGIYVTGYTYNSTATSDFIVLLKFDSSGSLVWQRTWGGSNTNWGEAVAVDSSGIYVTGETYSFGAGGSDVVLLKYDSSGNLVWQKIWGGSGDDVSQGVVVDSSGIYVMGYTNGFGAGDFDVLLLKYDFSGNLVWQRTWGGSSNDGGRGVVVDSSGIYVTGPTYSFGAGGCDALLLKYDFSGNLVWQRTWGGSSDDRGQDVVVDSSVIYVTGNTVSASRTLRYVSGTAGTPSGTTGTPSGTVGTPSVAAATPSGVVGTPTGSETYAGGSDVFLLRFAPGAPGTLTVTVWVRDAATGQAIGGAQVFLDGASRGYSNVMGLLTIADVGPGTHTASASKTGYSTFTPIQFSVSRSATVAIVLTRVTSTVTTVSRSTIISSTSSTTTILTTSIITTAVSTSVISAVNIQVRDARSTNTPVAGAMVYLDGRYAGSTDLNGQLTLTGVNAGRHQLVVMRSGYITQTATLSAPWPWTVTIYLAPR